MFFSLLHWYCRALINGCISVLFGIVMIVMHFINGSISLLIGIAMHLLNGTVFHVVHFAQPELL